MIFYFDDPPALSLCTYCARDLYRGELAWRVNGETICADCLSAFARELLAPYAFCVGSDAAIRENHPFTQEELP